MVTSDHIEQVKAHAIAAIKTFAPACINLLCPGLGRLFELGDAYTNERAAQNFEKLIELLHHRVHNLEERLNKIEDGASAEKIKSLIKQICLETYAEKISFYASIIAGEIMQTSSDWDNELQDQFVKTINDLTGPELIILQAMNERKPGESLSLPDRGKTWLDKRIVVNPTWLAWIDSLGKKGLVIDASFEKLSSNLTQLPVKSGTAYRLSNFARSMIEFMREVQKTTEK